VFINNSVNKRRALLHIIFSTFFILFSANKSFCAPTSYKKIFVVAKVNDQVITNLDLKDRYKFVLKISKISVNSKKEKLLLLNQLLQKMIDEELYIIEATNLGITADSSELNATLEKVALNQNKSINSFKKFFKKNYLSYDNYKKQVKSQILWSKIVKKTISSKVKVGESEIEEMLELKRIKSSVTQILLSEIYIPFDYKTGNNKINSENLSNKLAKELRKKKNFKSIAKQFSRSPTSEFGGEIGWVKKGDINSKIYQEIQDLPIGGISEPLLINDGYYLFKVSDKKALNNLGKKDMNEVTNYIFNKKLQTATKSYLMDLKKKSFIEINQDNLKNVN
jgi:peptidyl-prolyl cis-trans isomerase SurA